MDTVTELAFTAPYLAESTRPIRPEAGEAPVAREHIDPASMPRMCPGLARARLALYATARRMDIVGNRPGNNCTRWSRRRKQKNTGAPWTATKCTWRPARNAGGY